MLDTSATDIIREKPKRYLSLPIIGGFVFALLLIGFFVFSDIGNIFNTEQSYPLDRVRISEVVRGDFEHSISAEGKLAALVEPTLFASSEGRVSLLVRPGDKVTKGQELASIDNPALQSEYQTILSEFDSQKIELDGFRLDSNLKRKQSDQDQKLAKIRYEAAKRKLARYNTEDAQLAISLQDFEAAQDELLIAEAQYDNLQSTVKLLNEKLQFDLTVKSEGIVMIFSSFSFEIQSIKATDLVLSVSFGYLMH